MSAELPKGDSGANSSPVKSWSHRDLMANPSSSSGGAEAGQQPAAASVLSSPVSDKISSIERSLSITSTDKSVLRSPGGTPITRVSMSGQIESFEGDGGAAPPSSLPFQDKNSSIEDKTPPPSWLIAMEKRMNQLEQSNNIVVSELKIQLAKETDKAERLEDTCNQLKEQVQSLWSELEEEKTQRKQLVESIQKTSQKKKRRQSGGGPSQPTIIVDSIPNNQEETVYGTELLSTMKREAEKKEAVKRRMSGGSYKSAASQKSTVDLPKNQDGVVYSTEMLENLKKDAIKKARRMSEKSASSYKSETLGDADAPSSDDDDDEDGQPAVYSSDVLDSMKKEAVAKVSATTATTKRRMSGKSHGSGRAVASHAENTTNPDGSVVYNSEVLSTMKKDAIQRRMSGGKSVTSEITYDVDDGGGGNGNAVYSAEVLDSMKKAAIQRQRLSMEKSPGGSRSSPDDPHDSSEVNGCAVCLRVKCILLVVLIVMVGLVAGSYYIGKSTFPKRATIIPNNDIVDTMPPSTLFPDDEEEATMVPTATPSSFLQEEEENDNTMSSSNIEGVRRHLRKSIN